MITIFISIPQITTLLFGRFIARKQAEAIEKQEAADKAKNAELTLDEEKSKIEKDLTSTSTVELAVPLNYNKF